MPFHFPDACGKNGVDVRGEGRLVHSHRFVEFEVAADGLPVEVEIIEVQAKQDITLLDVARTQDTVPRPVLVDGAFAVGNGIGALQNLVHIAVIWTKIPRSGSSGRYIRSIMSRQRSLSSA